MNTNWSILAVILIVLLLIMCTFTPDNVRRKCPFINQTDHTAIIGFFLFVFLLVLIASTRCKCTRQKKKCINYNNIDDSGVHCTHL